MDTPRYPWPKEGTNTIDSDKLCRASSKSLGEVPGGGKAGTDIYATCCTVEETAFVAQQGAQAVTAAGGGNPPCGVESQQVGTDCLCGDHTGTSGMATNRSVPQDPSEQEGQVICAQIVTITGQAVELHTLSKVTCYSEKGCAATPGVGVGTLHPLIDIALTQCLSETYRDEASTGKNGADGAHIVDLCKDFEVKCPEISSHNCVSADNSVATDVLVSLTVCDNKKCTCAPGSEGIGNAICVSTGEETGIPALIVELCAVEQL